MKQQIIQISNIKLTEAAGIKKLADATQTYIYEDYKRLNRDASDEELLDISHRGFVLANLLNYYECTYDVETITPNDARYQEAVDEISKYKETDWFMDDADSYQSDAFDLLDETYEFEHQHTLYMYFDDWTQHGYEAFLGFDKWDAAFEQIIYEYMRRFLQVEII